MSSTIENQVQDIGEDLSMKINRIVDCGFIQKILRDSERDQSIEVVNVSIRAATNKGDNYTSDMFRVNIAYEKRPRESDSRVLKQSKTLIVKVEPLTVGVHQDMISKSSLFDTEIAMMTDTLSRMNELLGTTTLSARGLYTQSEKPPLLIIEDLAPLGFRMADRRAGLDMDHCLLAIRGLAKFHASSVALCERDPRQKARYTRGMFNECQPSEMRRFFIQGTKQLAEEAATWPELDPKIPQKIMKMADSIYDRGCEACVCRESEFNVINHGDFWVNNMLFKYNEAERPIGHIFVDFQLCVYSSPGVDLNYFFNTSLTNDALSLYEETLVHEYTRTLASAMASTGCHSEPPNVEQVKSMIRERIVYGMIASFAILPILLVCKSEVKDLKELLGSPDGEIKNPAYSGHLYRKAMLNRLPKFDQMGLLD